MAKVNVSREICGCVAYKDGRVIQPCWNGKLQAPDEDLVIHGAVIQAKCGCAVKKYTHEWYFKCRRHGGNGLRIITPSTQKFTFPKLDVSKAVEETKSQLLKAIDREIARWVHEEQELRAQRVAAWQREATERALQEANTVANTKSIQANFERVQQEWHSLMGQVGKARPKAKKTAPDRVVKVNTKKRAYF